jgi:hypothetical protein
VAWEEEEKGRKNKRIKMGKGGNLDGEGGRGNRVGRRRGR